MENRYENCPKNNPVVYFLLPICVDSQYDVFFNLLKNVVSRVGRAKLANYYLDNAFKSGIMGEEMRVDVTTDNISSIWNKRSTKQDLIRQSKLLGYWTSTNCATFGKVFFGDSWRSPKGNFVQVVSSNGIQTMTAAQIDAIVFPKMKIHLIELNVSESTLKDKLKNFVQVPINEIDVYNMSQISPKMKSYDIKNEYVEKSWTALKRGKWMINTDTEVRKNCVSA